MTEGFYKQDDSGEWYFAPNGVYSPTYSLTKENKDSLQLPIDGWDWYNEAPEAYLIWTQRPIE